VTDTSVTTDAGRRNLADGIAHTINGRTYGQTSADSFANLRQMPVPKEMDALVAALHRESKLLALTSGSPAEAIHNAYGADLQLLIRYRNAFRQTIEAAVHARADTHHTDAQAFLADMVRTLGDIAHEPNLDLSADTVKLEPAQLLARMQDEFRSDAEDLKAGVAIWLHALVENDIVSVIERLGAHGVKYHFYHMTSYRQEVDCKKDDPGVSLRGRFVTTTVKTAVNVVSERRVHTVVNAESHALEDYTRRVPARIARLIDAIPAEVKQFVTIMDGNVSKEEVYRRQESGEIVTETHKVWVADPTPALFDSWALAGWGGSLAEPARSTYQGHVAQKANKEFLIAVVLTLLLSGLAFRFDGIRAGSLVLAVCLILVLMRQMAIRIAASR
jgi:hypothetical protein